MYKRRESIRRGQEGRAALGPKGSLQLQKAQRVLSAHWVRASQRETTERSPNSSGFGYPKPPH